MCVVPEGDKEDYSTSFFADFWHLNVGMWASNNALVPDPDKEPDILVSQPTQWPLIEVGLRMNSWNDGDDKVYLLGNPVIWLSSTAALVMYIVFWFFYTLRMKRGYVYHPCTLYFY